MMRPKPLTGPTTTALVDWTSAEFFPCPWEACLWLEIPGTLVKPCLIRWGSAWIVGVLVKTRNHDFELQTNPMPWEVVPAGAARFCVANDIPLPAALVAVLNGPDTGMTERSTPPEAPPANPGPAASRTEPPAAADPVGELRKADRPIQAALVEYLLPRKRATFDAIKRDVHGDKEVSDNAVRKRVSETNKNLVTIGSKLKLSTASGYVFLNDPPE
jgi:hypothetical protein